MRIAVAICLLLLVAPEAMAEVSDKAASQPQLWLEGALVGGAAFIAGLYRPLLGIVIGLLFSLLLGYAAYDTLADSHLWSALLAEQGESYRVAIFASPVLCAVGSTAGVLLGLRFRNIFGDRRAAS